MKILESYKYIAKSLFIEASQDDEDYVSIGWGKYKEKGKEKDSDAQIFKKTDSGKFEPVDGDKGGEEEPKGGEEKPKGGGMGAGDFERDFDDSDDEPDYGDTRNAQHFSAEPEDKPFGGDTGKDADFQGEPPEGAREPDDVDDDEPEGGEWEFTDDTNLWDPNGPEDREEIMKALLKDPEISAKLGDEPYWDDVDLVPDDDEGETAATLEPGMTFGDMKKQILGKKGDEEGANAEDIAKKIRSQSDDPDADIHRLGDLDDFSDALTSGPDAKELRKRVDSGEEAYYVQTDEMDGFVVYDDGDVYEVHGDQGGDAWVTKTDDWSGGKDESITINGKKYRPIKESKKHILKENYERLFRSLK